MKDILYKVDSKGKVRFWQIETDKNSYTASHGVVGSQNIVSSTTYVTGKNIGRANETTAEQQAVLEANSLVKKQIDKNYSPSLRQATALDVGVLPMLAQRYDEHAPKIIFPAYIQPKLDGIRCLAVIKDGEIKLISRKGKEFKAVEHLKKKIISSLKVGTGDVILDGELYSHSMTFQQITSATKRDTPNEKTKDIEYHIYDIADEKLHFSERHQWIRENIKSNENIKIVWTFEVSNVEDILERNRENLKRGYEGSMIRNTDGVYEFDKRSYNLQKFKNFIDDEFEIIGAEENKGKRAGQACFICKTKDGKEFAVNMMGSDTDREEYWANHKDYIGKFVTVRYFQLTDDGKPRFPVGVGVREDL